MKKVAILSLVGLSAIACQQQAVQEPVQPVYQQPVPVAPAAPVAPVVSAPVAPSTGTCVFGAKSGSTSETTTHNDCLLRGGDFIPSNSGFSAPAPAYSSPAPVYSPAPVTYAAPAGNVITAPVGVATPVNGGGGMAESL
jgi:hypothetical protein